VWTRNHFNQGCVGCHEDPELTPENFVPTALNQPSAVLNPPAAERPTVTFVKDILPLIKSKCLPCHGENGSLPKLPPASQSLALFQAVCGGAKDAEIYVHPGQSRTSPLIWHALGQNTSRPWDDSSVNAQFKSIPADSSIQLADSEKRLLAQWIDLGAIFDVDGRSDGHSNE
jgi:hypothetical protein